MQKSQSSDFNNSAPWSARTVDDLVSSLAKIGGASRKKRCAEGGEPSFVRKTAKTTSTNNCWKCATTPDGHWCGVCGVKGRVEKRDSITSSIDDLVQNLEGLEFDVGHSSRASLGDSWNDSTSRLSSGRWSWQDVEKWSCSTCTYENEPVYCACEMCGQSRPAWTPALREESSSANILEESVKVLQEQRLRELLQFGRPAAPVKEQDTLATPITSATRSKSTATNKPPLAAKKNISPRTAAYRSISPVPDKKMLVMSGSGRELNVRDLFDEIPSLNKARPYQPEDSTATATTFDMSASTCDFFPITEQLVYPGIEEEEPGCFSSTKSSPPRSTNC